MIRRAAVGAARRTVWRLPLRVRRGLLRPAAVRRARASAYRRLGHTIVPVPEHGFSMSVDLRQLDHRAHFRTPHVERGLVSFLREHTAPGAIAVDAGAFCGYYTLLMAVRAGPGGHVFAFEPLPEHADLVAANVALNFLGNVTVERAALGSEVATGTLTVAGPSSSLLPTEGAATREVGVVPLDSYVEARGLDRLDVVKLDVEGAEVEALEGMRAVMRALSPVVAVEVNTDAVQQEVERLLADTGYTVSLLGTESHGRHLGAVPRRLRTDRC